MNAKLNELPDFDSLWMPFTANRQFKAAPRLLVGASGMYYTAQDGRRVLDGTAGLWCVNAGHCRSEIADAVARQARELDYAPGFQMGHPLAFEAASRVARLMPPGLDRIFFTNSGSESVDTAIKIALAYHRARGESQRHRFIGRERGYHGVGFGGISVGGSAPTSCRGSITCRTRSTSPKQPTRAANLPGVRTWRTIWSASWRCTMLPPSPP
jgi:beta-alanine--pyruvate transaminase